MKLLYFADTRFPIERANGAQTMATCQALARRGHEVTLHVRPDSAPAQRDPFAFYDLPAVDRLKIAYLTAPRGEHWRRATFLLTAALAAGRHRDAIVYTRDLGLASFLTQLPSLRRPKVVYESHGIAPVVSEEMPALLGKPELAASPRKIERLDRRERRVWKRAAAYVAITRALADDLAARYGPRPNVFVVPDGAAARGDTAPAPNRRPLAAYAGHLYPWKGVDILVRALAAAPDLRGLIVGGHPGESDRARVEALARDCGVSDRLEITGLIPQREVAARLAAATMLVLPNVASTISERYTSPLKLFEYLALGLPIVASDLASIREVLQPGRTALLVPPGDAGALAAAMTRLAGDPDLSASLGSAARGLAGEYTWERRAERLEPALEAAARG
ncbi:MAG TPA: glycosyltransferase family 4 protein [Vicinamibacterales bacterium]|nr:glycosyltransferase family 4 protein [Vicinamibacterales bacterium]